MSKFSSKIFIVDGPDGTGKTTLCRKLSDLYNIPVYHLTYFSDTKKHVSQFDKANKLFQDKIYKPDEDGFILDRYLLSEYVYASVYRDGKTFDNR